MSQTFFTYLLSNESRDAYYAGVTCDLMFAVSSHRQGLANTFTRDHGVNRLVWFRPVGDLIDALRHKKRLRELSDQSKAVLVELENPDWDDLLDSDAYELIA